MDLAEYRIEQRKLAMLRDDGLCQVCLRQAGRVDVQASEVHHVYGRHRIPCLHESHFALLCMCKEHHDDVHLESYDVEASSIWANLSPVEPQFVRKYMSVTDPDDSLCIDVSNKNVDHLCMGNEHGIIWVSSTGLCPYCLQWFVIV